MATNNPINLPAGYAPAFAVGFAEQSGELAVVDSATPLPVTIPAGTTIAVQAVNAAAPAPLEGQASANVIAGPFAPAAIRPVVLTLSGQWEGTVQVQRSTDAGATRHPLTAGGVAWGTYSGNACEPVWAEEEEGVELYLDITVTSGTLDYRIAQ